MEKLSAKEMRRTLEWLLQVALCPVCHEILTPAVVQCVRGHAVCVTCHRGLPTQECPLCRDVFSDVQTSSFIQQVVEALPHPCRHDGCKYFVKTKDNHEKFCLFKSTKCRYCEWSGPATELLHHIQQTHPMWAQKFLAPCAAGNGMPFNPQEEVSAFTPIIVDGHFFWGEMKSEPDVGKLTATIHHVPCGKSTSVFKASVKLLNLKDQPYYKADIKLNTEPEINAYVENCISIPTSIIHKSVIDNKLKYKISIVKIKLESMSNFVQSKLEFLKN